MYEIERMALAALVLQSTPFFPTDDNIIRGNTAKRPSDIIFIASESTKYPYI